MSRKRKDDATRNGPARTLADEKTWPEFSLAPRLIHLLKSRIIRIRKLSIGVPALLF